MGEQSLSGAWHRFGHPCRGLKARDVIAWANASSRAAAQVMSTIRHQRKACIAMRTSQIIGIILLCCVCDSTFELFGQNADSTGALPVRLRIRDSEVKKLELSKVWTRADKESEDAFWKSQGLTNGPCLISIPKAGGYYLIMGNGRVLPLIAKIGESANIDAIWAVPKMDIRVQGKEFRRGISECQRLCVRSIEDPEGRIVLDDFLGGARCITWSIWSKSENDLSIDIAVSVPFY